MLCGALVGQLVVALSCHVTLREKEQAATIVAVVVVVVDSEKAWYWSQPRASVATIGIARR